MATVVLYGYEIDNFYSFSKVTHYLIRRFGWTDAICSKMVSNFNNLLCSNGLLEWMKHGGMEYYLEI